MTDSVELKGGDAAPDFTLPAIVTKPEVARTEVSLNDYRGRRNVAIAFYTFAFTST